MPPPLQAQSKTEKTCLWINEELEKDMQRLKNEIDMFQVELLALEKENLTSKRVSHFLLLWFFSFLMIWSILIFHL